MKVRSIVVEDGQSSLRHISSDENMIIINYDKQIIIVSDKGMPFPASREVIPLSRAYSILEDDHE